VIQHKNVIDTRISELIKECLDKAVNIIETNKEYFNKLSNKLMLENTIVFD